MNKNWLMGLLLLLGVVLQVKWTTAKPSTKKPLPSFLKVCHRDSPDLNTCARESYEKLRPRLMEGIPELFIPAMEPLIVPQVKMDQDSGAIYLHSVYRNVKVTGISKHTVNELRLEPSKLKFIVSLTFPKLHMESDYSIKGKIMMMPLLGDGHCKVDLINITMRTELIGQEYKRDEVNYLKINTVKVKYELSDVHIHLDNLFNGDKALGDRMNEFLNENWKALAEEVRPLMSKALVDILRASVDKLFASFSYDDLLPKGRY
ncbi:circadian clock-controlled protein daywake [Drosophila rhopaloa]|uniref:Circadian clock-controlled protein n=1 Tax=Drosophila rhopaloa TaxID=1041015 RepID=A0A6P4F1N3_DRORH|nr:circadian clock-controlled protein daywake [Drosophila rhopaloa]